MYGGIGTWPVVGYVAGSISFDWQGFPSLISNGTATLLGEHPLPLASVAALFVLYLWFWNQIFTWVGVSRIIEAKCSLSGALRYFCWRKRLSSSNVCALENSTRLFRFLCSVSWGWISFACCSSSNSADSSSLHSWLASCFGGNDRSEMVGLVESGCCNTAIFAVLWCYNVEEYWLCCFFLFWKFESKEFVDLFRNWRIFRTNEGSHLILDFELLNLWVYVWQGSKMYYLANLN